MAELTFRTSARLTDEMIDEAIETNQYITIIDWKRVGDKLTFIPMFPQALEEKFDVCHFAIHMGKQLRAIFVNIKE